MHILAFRKKLWYSHCDFSLNLLHGQMAQIYIDHLSRPETKYLALEKSLEQSTLKPCDFWAEEVLKAGRPDCLNITSPRKWHSNIFKFLQENVSGLDKKAPAHFYTILEIVVCKHYVVRPLHSSQIVCQHLLDLSFCTEKFQRSFGNDLLSQFSLFLLEPQEAKSDLPMTNWARLRVFSGHKCNSLTSLDFSLYNCTTGAPKRRTQ